MSTMDDNDKIINSILKDAHSEIEPTDSWQALRDRIDRRIDGEGLPSASAAGMKKNIVFWRRLAFGMAACFLLTAGLLIYSIGFRSGIQKYQQQQFTTGGRNNVFNQSDLYRLSAAFSQVRQLFGQQSPWIVVSSDNIAEIGIDSEAFGTTGASKVIVLRLALNLENRDERRRYFDVVMFANQQASFRLPLVDDSIMVVSLMPTLKDDGLVAVELKAQINGGSQARSVSTVAGDSFTSLVRLRANGGWVNIDGIGRLMSEI